MKSHTHDELVTIGVCVIIAWLAFIAAVWWWGGFGWACLALIAFCAFAIWCQTT